MSEPFAAISVNKHLLSLLPPSGSPRHHSGVVKSRHDSHTPSDVLPIHAQKHDTLLVPALQRTHVCSLPRSLRSSCLSHTRLDGSFLSLPRHLQLSHLLNLPSHAASLSSQLSCHLRREALLEFLRQTPCSSILPAVHMNVYLDIYVCMYICVFGSVLFHHLRKME